MPKRRQQESMLLGALVGGIVGLALVLFASVLVDFGGDDTAPTNAAAPESTTTTVAAQQGVEPGTGQGQGAGQGQAAAGQGQGVGQGQGAGGGPPEGRGPGSHPDGELADPLSFGTASPEVLDAFGAGGCVACHTIKGVGGGAARIGPGLSRLGEVGDRRVPGLSIPEYIEQSIREPGAFVRPNCPGGPCLDGLMPQTYAETLTADQISTIVGYLSVLGTAAEADVLSAPGG